MSAQLPPIADLARALDRLEHELSDISELDGTSPAYFCSRLLPILAALADASVCARAAIEPAMIEEAHRANAAERYRSKLPAEEA